MRDYRKIGVAAVAALVIGAGVYWGFLRHGDPASAVAPTAGGVIVEAAPVLVQPMQQEVSAIGTLRSEDSIVMRPELAGVVTAIGFQEGQPVRKGQLLIALDNSIYEAELAQASVAVKPLRAGAEAAAQVLQPLADAGAWGPGLRQM